MGSMAQRRKWLLFGLILVGILLCIIAFSGMVGGWGSAPAQASPQAEPTFSMAGTAFDLLVKLTLVAGLIVVTVWLLRRFMTRRHTPSHGYIEVVDRTHLSPNTVLYLVEVGGKFVLLGSTSNQLSLLTEIADPLSLARLREPKKAASPGRVSISQSLSSLAARLLGGGTSGVGKQAFHQVLTRTEAAMVGKGAAAKAKASAGQHGAGQDGL